jgi:hypothetical protein
MFNYFQNIAENYIARDYIPSRTSSFNYCTALTFSSTTSPSGGSEINLEPYTPSLSFSRGSYKFNANFM